MTTIELYRNANFYESHPFIEFQHSCGAFNGIESAFRNCASGPAIEAFENHEHESLAAAEASYVAKDFSFSSFFALLALSSAIEMPIESYFPIRTTGECSELKFENRNSEEILFNGTVLPRKSPPSKSVEIHLFGCALAPVDFIQTRKIPETKNLYVPLLLPDDFHHSGTQPPMISPTMEPTAPTNVVSCE